MDITTQGNGEEWAADVCVGWALGIVSGMLFLVAALLLVCYSVLLCQKSVCVIFNRMPTGFVTYTTFFDMSTSV